MPKYCVIKVDYFVYDETKEDGLGRMPCYLYVTRNKLKVYIFKPELSAEHFDLKWFETKEEAQEYISKHNLKDSICYDNVRVEEVEYTL